MRRIAVIGASGFVGSTLVERLLAQGHSGVVPFIHSSGNAMRLARLGIELRVLDLLVGDDVNNALRGCTHVVNCALGDADVMVNGLRNLLMASRKNHVERFVHLSSVLVYGDPPPAESVHENGPTNPTGMYGRLKLQQDQMVRQASRRGLPSVILCPPNISGPYSPFLVRVVDSLRAGEFALLEEGNTSCNLVDVSNLAYAIELALNKGTGDGKRMFVTDAGATTWRDVIEGLSPATERVEPLPHITREELARLRMSNGESPVSILRGLKHLVSHDVRAALRKDPLWAKIEEGVGQTVTRLGKVVEERLRLSIAGPPSIAKSNCTRHYDMHLSVQQLRGVRHACDLAKQELGYQPVYTFPASMRAFCAWYRSHHGMDSGSWDLLKRLYVCGERKNG